jgi:hypothetical protein
VLGIDPSASESEVRQAFLNGSWGLWWRAETDEEIAFAVELRDRAYATLADPWRRAQADEELGLSRDDIARQVGTRARWGTVWAWLMGFLAVFCLLDTDNASRFLGENFAPDFGEQRIYHPDWDDGESNPYESRFFSSNPTWEKLLNNWLVVGLAPAVVLGLAAAAGKLALDQFGSRWIARVRYRGASDEWPQRILWAIAIAVPIAVGVYTATYGLGSTDYETVVAE